MPNKCPIYSKYIRIFTKAGILKNNIVGTKVDSLPIETQNQERILFLPLQSLMS